MTYSWTDIASGDLDPDSPITTELMSALYENGQFMHEWVGAKANADANHRHRGLGTDGTANVQYGDLGGSPPGPVQGMCTWTGLVVEGAGAQVVFGTASTIGFWPVALILNVAVLGTQNPPGVFHDTYNWAGRASASNAGHYQAMVGGAFLAGTSAGSWFSGAVAVEPGTGAALSCLSMGAPGMAATFQWNIPVPMLWTRQTSITVTAIGL